MFLLILDLYFFCQYLLCVITFRIFFFLVKNVLHSLLILMIDLTLLYICFLLSKCLNGIGFLVVRCFCLICSLIKRCFCFILRI